MTAAERPERWGVDAGAAEVARLEIPPHASRGRGFEISVTFQVVWRGDDQAEAWHGLKLLVDGRQQWSRRVPTHPGPSDSLDYRFRRTVPAGEPLKLVATGEVHRTTRLRLVLTAEEE
jgi:hypothetical protein